MVELYMCIPYFGTISTPKMSDETAASTSTHGCEHLLSVISSPRERSTYHPRVK